MPTELEQPAPRPGKTVTVEVGVEVIGDRLPVAQLRQYVDELEERAPQLFVIQGTGEHRPLYATRAKESRPLPRGGSVKSASDSENAGLQ